MMSSHYKKEHSDIPKQVYKVDLLNANGRKQKLCKTCGKPTHINKGEKEYNDYCDRECYNKSHYFTTSENNPYWKGGKTKYTCKFCDKEFEKYSSVTNGINIFCSISCSAKYYYCLKNKINVKDYKPVERQYDEALLKSLSRQCLRNFNYTCDICDERGGILEAHHINNKKFFPDQVYDIDNLVCLCRSCHNKVHSVCGIGRDYPITRVQYQIFKAINKPNY